MLKPSISYDLTKRYLFKLYDPPSSFYVKLNLQLSGKRIEWYKLNFKSIFFLVLKNLPEVSGRFSPSVSEQHYGQLTPKIRNTQLWQKVASRRTCISNRGLNICVIQLNIRFVHSKRFQIWSEQFINKRIFCS